MHFFTRISSRRGGFVSYEHIEMYGFIKVIHLCNTYRGKILIAISCHVEIDRIYLFIVSVQVKVGFL